MTTTTTTTTRRAAIPAEWRVCQDSRKCLLLVRHGHRFGDPEILIDRRMELLTIHKGDAMVFAYGSEMGEGESLAVALEWLKWNDDAAF